MLERLGAVDTGAGWEDVSRTVVRSSSARCRMTRTAGACCSWRRWREARACAREREQALAPFQVVRPGIPRRRGARDGKALDLPADMLLGAVRSIVSQNLRTHSEDRMGLLVDDVMGWIESYARPGRRAGLEHRAEHAAAGPGRGAMACRRLAAAAPQRLPRGRHRLPPAAVERSQRTRIIHGTSEVMVAKGYAAATVADIVSAAGISRDVFYTHFANKYEAYLAAQEYGTQNLLEACAAGLLRRADLARACLAGAAGTGARRRG